MGKFSLKTRVISCLAHHITASGRQRAAAKSAPWKPSQRQREMHLRGLPLSGLPGSWYCASIKNSTLRWLRLISICLISDVASSRAVLCRVFSPDPLREGVQIHSGVGLKYPKMTRNPTVTSSPLSCSVAPTSKHLVRTLLFEVLLVGGSPACPRSRDGSKTSCARRPPTTGPCSPAARARPGGRAPSIVPSALSEHCVS